MGLGELRLTGSPVSASYDPVNKIVTLEVAPRLDTNFDFGHGAQSFPILSGPVVLDRNGTTIEVVNTATITDIYNFIVPAGVMNANSLLRLTVFGDFKNDSGLGARHNWRVYFGGTGGDLHINQQTNFVTTSALRRPWRMEVLIGNLDSLSSQFVAMKYALGRTEAGAVGLGNLGGTMEGGGTGGTAWHVMTSETLGTRDTATAERVQVRVDHNAGVDPDLSIRKRYAVLELL